MQGEAVGRRRDEGIFVGLSSGVNVAGARACARERGPGGVIVTILCDSGVKYAGRLGNSAWLAERGLRDDLALETAWADLEGASVSPA